MDFPKEAILPLMKFVELVKANPDILHVPNLKFFKEFIESFGGKVPPPSKPSPTSTSEANKPKPEAKQEEAPPPYESDPESDIELDNSGVLETPDATPEPLKEYNPDEEISEETLEASNAKKMNAISAFQDGEFQKAYDSYSEAIELNPNSALMFAKRGQCSLKLNKPNACIRDCSRALEINPDSAPAYKFRGRAHRLLGNWEDAAKDLRNACKIDFDEQVDEWLKEVTPNARKLEEHRRKYERKHAERELQERAERIKFAREAHAAAAAAAAAAEEPETEPDFFSFMTDPEMKMAFSNPEVVEMLEDIAANPSNIIKYQDNPKILAVIEKMKSKGAFGGGFNPFGATAPPPPSSSGPADVDLD